MNNLIEDFDNYQYDSVWNEDKKLNSQIRIEMKEDFELGIFQMTFT